MERLKNFEDKLIDLVEIHPVLYDVKCADYKRNNIRLQVWNTIAEQLGSTCKSIILISYFEKNKQPKVPFLAKECQMKWKNIRYSYFKNKREGKIPSGNPSKKKKYSRDLNFLDPFNININIDYPEKTVSNFEVVDVSVCEFTETVKTSPIDRISCDDFSADQSTSTSTPIPPRSVSMQKRRHTNEALLNKIENTLNKISADDAVVDGIEHFCLSLVDSLRAMDRIEQERVKFEFSKILRDAKYEY